MSAVHLEQDGRPLCNRPGATSLTTDPGQVTCKQCAKPLQPCGTRAAYLRHLNHAEDPHPQDTAAALQYQRDRLERLAVPGRIAAAVDEIASRRTT